MRRAWARMVPIALAVGCSDVDLNPTLDRPTECTEEPVRVTAIPSASCVEPVGVSPVSVPWEVTTLWTFGEPDMYASSVMPVVGYLVDTNADGAFRAPDVPTVVVAVGPALSLEGTIVALRGTDGSELWRWGPAATNSSAVRLADLDGDGRPEVIAVDAERHIVALTANGAELWRSADSMGLPCAPSVILAGRDRSGTAFIVAGNLILDASTGAVRATVDEVAAIWFNIAALADLDLDGDPEVVTSGDVYSVEGEKLWRGHGSGAPLVVQLDDDPEAEVMFVGSAVTAFEHDGTEIPLDMPQFTGRSYGVACFGDLEGDGVAEVVWPADTELYAVNVEGDTRWVTAMTDTSGLAGCSLADLDADGQFEVLFADEESFRILDGTTGATLFEDRERASGTAVEVPVPADVDGDGHLDIVVVNDSVAPPVHVYTHAGPGWAPGGVGWPSYDYAVTNGAADGTLPPQMAPWWQMYNLVRGRPAADAIPLADLVVAFEGSCDAGGVTVRVTNEGLAAVPPGVEVVVQSEGQILARAVLPGLASGEGVEGVWIHAGEEEASEGASRAIIVDPDGTVPECTIENNRVELP